MNRQAEYLKKRSDWSEQVYDLLYGAAYTVSDRGRIYPCDFLPLIPDRLFVQAVFFILAFTV